MSCSYGPGRYDDDYEFKGQDYPLAFVQIGGQKKEILKQFYKLFHLEN